MPISPSSNRLGSSEGSSRLSSSIRTTSGATRSRAKPSPESLSRRSSSLSVVKAVAVMPVEHNKSVVPRHRGRPIALQSREMLATERLSIRPYHVGDEEFIATLAHEAFVEYTPYAVPHTLAMVRRCTTLVALRERLPPAEGALDVEGAPASPRVPPQADKRPQRQRMGFAAISD